MAEKVKTQEYLGLEPDKKLGFKKHLKDEFAKLIGELKFWKKNERILTRHSLITLYKSFIRPHVDYADIIYDQPNHLNLCKKLKLVSTTYNAARAIAGAIEVPRRQRLYQKLGFEYLSSQRWLRKQCTFYRIVRNKSFGYLYKYISLGDRAYLTRNSNTIKQIFWMFCSELKFGKRCVYSNLKNIFSNLQERSRTV